MFNNVAFNVVIGLVFIYLLYSLLTTIVGEWLSSIFGLRQRILRAGIERMLNDGYNKRVRGTRDHKIKAWWSRLILAASPGFEQTFAGRFYDAPSVKYLSRIESDEKILFSNSKPSYISPDNFADTIITLLADKGAGDTKMKRISYCLSYNPHQIELETIKHLKNLFKDSNRNLDAFRTKLVLWYNETMDRTTGWHKRKMRMVLFWFSIIVAIAFNIDSIRIAKLLAKDNDARNQLVSMGIAFAKDSIHYKEFIESGKDSVSSQKVIDSAFSSVTKDIRAANLVLGLGWGFDTARIEAHAPLKGTNNSDSIKIAYEAVRNNIVIATAQLKNDQKSIDSIKRKLKGKEALEAKDSIRILQIQLLNLVFKQTDDSAFLNDKIASIKSMNKSLVTSTNGVVTEIAGISCNDSLNYVVDGKGPVDTCWKVKRFFEIIFCERGWLGFILTAFALSLGAPFWFGVLNKLVQLRASGPKPEDDTSELAKGTITPASQPTVKDIPLPPEEDLVAVVRIYTDAIRREPGVLNVGAGYIMINGQVEQCLQVHVENNDVAVAVRSKYKTLTVSQGVEFCVDVQVTGETVIMNGQTGVPDHPSNGIANQTKLHGIGSYGCVVNDVFIKNQLYLLTCFHVANGDDSWTVAPINKNIVDMKNTIIGKDYRYGFDEHHDTAIIEINPAIAAHYKALKNITTPPPCYRGG